MKQVHRWYLQLVGSHLALVGGKGRQVAQYACDSKIIYSKYIFSLIYIPIWHFLCSLLTSYEEGRQCWIKCKDLPASAAAASYMGSGQITEKIREGKAPRAKSLVSAGALLGLWEGRKNLTASASTSSLVTHRQHSNDAGFEVTLPSRGILAVCMKMKESPFQSLTHPPCGIFSDMQQD